jgi:GDPmannose 4,6-dehydratase
MILAGRQDKLYLGNLDARRDWGYAPEYVGAMWLILQQARPGDYVVGTGQSHSVKEFVERAFAYVGLEWQRYVVVDQRYFRPTEVEFLLANPAKARRELGWEPKVSFDELIKIMVDADMEAVGLQPPGEGKQILQARFGRWHHWDSSVSKALSNAGRGVD